MKRSATSSARGFTLVELLVSVAIITTLGGVTTAGYLSMREKARMTTEINAARNLAVAYLADAADHNGHLMPGYQTDPETTDLSGRTLPYPMNARYPWRLAASAPSVDGIFLFNGNERVLDEENSDYLVSVSPNLGINAVLVGGHYGSGSPLAPTPRIVDYFGKFYIDRLAEAVSPEKLVVFASARSGKDRPGYFEVRPPRLTNKVWSSDEFSEDSPASRHGFVDFRYGKKAVVANLAGNVELLTEDQLRDMRRWSNQAERAGDKDFTIKPVN